MKTSWALLWDRRSDKFQMGQWMKGRIYERRCDLSHDGRYLLYLTMNARWQSEAKGAWTAISRAPYLKAVALFPKGDCWLGGGLWTGSRRYWLNGGGCHEVLWDTREVQRDTGYQLPGPFGSECPSVYYPRLMRDGWRLVERTSRARWQSEDLFEKPAGQDWILRKIAHGEVGARQGKGSYWDEHYLLRDDDGARIDCPHWEWADLDRERLVWATGGRLYSGYLAQSGLMAQTELIDFNLLAFEPIQAPY